MHNNRRYQTQPVPTRRPRSDPDGIANQLATPISPMGTCIPQSALQRYKSLADTINAAEEEREQLRRELIRRIERGDTQESGDLAAELKTSIRRQLTQDNVRQILGRAVLDTLLESIPPTNVKNLIVRRM